MPGIDEVMADELAMTGSVVIAEALNIGRDVGLKAYKDDLEAYQWSAVLDDRVCPECEWLDGRYFDPNNPNVDVIYPPLHANCRCIMVGVLREEVEKYPIEKYPLDKEDTAKLIKNKFWIKPAGLPVIPKEEKGVAGLNVRWHKDMPENMRDLSLYDPEDFKGKGAVTVVPPLTKLPAERGEIGGIGFNKNGTGGMEIVGALNLPEGNKIRDLAEKALEREDDWKTVNKFYRAIGSRVRYNKNGVIYYVFEEGAEL